MFLSIPHPQPERFPDPSLILQVSLWRDWEHCEVSYRVRNPRILVNLSNR